MLKLQHPSPLLLLIKIMIARLNCLFLRYLLRFLILLTILTQLHNQNQILRLYLNHLLIPQIMSNLRLIINLSTFLLPQSHLHRLHLNQTMALNKSRFKSVEWDQLTAKMNKQNLFILLYFQLQQWPISFLQCLLKHYLCKKRVNLLNPHHHLIQIQLPFHQFLNSRVLKI